MFTRFNRIMKEEDGEGTNNGGGVTETPEQKLQKQLQELTDSLETLKADNKKLADNNKKLLDEKKKVEKKTVEESGDEKQIISFKNKEIEQLTETVANLTAEITDKKKKEFSVIQEKAIKKLFDGMEFHEFEDAKKVLDLSKLVFKDGNFDELGLKQLKEETLKNKPYLFKTKGEEVSGRGKANGEQEGEVSLKDYFKQVLKESK